MPSRSTEHLPAAIEHLRTWASTKGIAWVSGMLDATGGELPRVHFSDEGDQSPPLTAAKAFSRTLDALDVAMLVVSTITLDEDTQMAAVALFEGDSEFPDDPNDTDTNTFIEGMLADARAAHKHIGQPGSVLVSAITRNPPMAIEWSAMADWYFPIQASEQAYQEMEDVDIGPDADDMDSLRLARPTPKRTFGRASVTTVGPSP